MNDFNTDEFYSDWIRTTRRFGVGFLAIAVVYLLGGILAFYVHDLFWGTFSFIGALWTARQAYNCLVTRPIEIKADWANMKELDAILAAHSQNLKELLDKHRFAKIEQPPCEVCGHGYIKDDGRCSNCGEAGE